MENPSIAVIVPTIRQELFKTVFLPKWKDLFVKNRVRLFIVHDGDMPRVERLSWTNDYHSDEFFPDILEAQDVIYNYTDACRNLGFLTAKWEIDPDIYISLDDDVLPIEGTDPIAEHVVALSKTVNNNWLNTSTDHRMRGLPYHLPEYPVWLSHGVWKGVPDLDAIQQLQHPDMRDVCFEKTIVPRSVHFPLCAMNFAFRKELLPWAYQAPMGKKLLQDGLPAYDRFADIWSGLLMQYAITKHEAAAVTGYSTVHHTRASNVFANLKKEALGMELNEYMSDVIKYVYEQNGVPVGGFPEMANYLLLYMKRLKQWQKLIGYAE